MKKSLLILNVVGLIIALFWLMLEGTWEPLIASLGLIASLITILINRNKSIGKKIMKQKGGKNSQNFQSGGNININQND